MNGRTTLRNSKVANTIRTHKTAIAVLVPIALTVAILGAPLGFQTWYGANTSGWPSTIITFFQYFVPALALVAMGYNYFRTIQSGSGGREALMEFAIVVPISIFVAGLLIPLGLQMWYGVLVIPAYYAVRLVRGASPRLHALYHN